MFLELQWEDLGSSLVAMRTSGNFSCCLRELKLLLCCDGSTGLLEPLQWNQASSRIEGGISCLFVCLFLSCCRKLWAPLELQWDLMESLLFCRGSQVCLQVARGTSGFFCSCCRGIGPHLELMRETQGFSRVATGISGFLLTFNRGVRPCLMLNHRTPLSSRVIKWVSSLLLS